MMNTIIAVIVIGLMVMNALSTVKPKKDNGLFFWGTIIGACVIGGYWL